MRRSALRLLLLLLLALVLGAALSCVITTDESLWQRHRDAARDLQAHELVSHDGPLDVSGDRPDGGKLDAPGADQPGTDGPRPDKPKLDIAKLDKPKPDKTKPDQSCKSIVLLVGATADDGVIYDALYPDGDPDDNLLWAGWMSGTMLWSYLRFSLPLAIPATATITVATLSLWGGASDNWAATSAVEIWTENSANAAAVTAVTDTPFLPGGRPMTSSVRWPTTGGLIWSLGQYNTSPSLAGVLQALVVSKGGLASGAHLQLWLRAAQTVEGSVVFPDYSKAGYSSNPSKLAISFCQ
jgi:hypothetical protein